MKAVTMSKLYTTEEVWDMLAVQDTCDAFEQIDGLIGTFTGTKNYVSFSCGHGGEFECCEESWRSLSEFLRDNGGYKFEIVGEPNA